jgi:hypothetical protein
MKKLTSISAIAILAGGLAACTPEERVVGGGLIGAGTGALIGSAVTGGRASGAWAGAAIGGLTGAAVGATSGPRECARWRRDYYGNPVCVAYY